MILFDTKAFGLLDGECELLLQRLVIFVRGEINPVEACMTPWQLRRVPGFVQREATGTITTLEILETVDRHTAMLMSQ